MDLIYTIIGALFTVLGVLWSIVWWFLSFLLMPLLILVVLAAFALRFAWRQKTLKPYVEKLFARLGGRGRAWGLGWLQWLLYMLTVEPFRVIFRFIWFSLLHAWINLWWRPRWTPWTRARERPRAKNQSQQ